jgi:hypothetical protein
MAFKPTTSTRRILEIEPFKCALGLLSASVGMFAVPEAASPQINVCLVAPALPGKIRLQGYAMFATLRVLQGPG